MHSAIRDGSMFELLSAGPSQPSRTPRPSKRSVQSLIADIHEQTSSKRGLLAAEYVVARLNRQLRGWANYFKAGPVSRCYRYLDRYTADRLRRWLYRKHKMDTGMYTQFPDEFLHKDLGLFSLSVFQKSLPWAGEYRSRARSRLPSARRECCRCDPSFPYFLSWCVISCCYRRAYWHDRPSNVYPSINGLLVRFSWPTVRQLAYKET
jgi:hypothetical protein